MMNKIRTISQKLYLSLIFKYAQKIHKLNRRKHLYVTNLKRYSNRNEKNKYDLHVNLFKTALEIVDKQISDRKSEINEILLKVKNLYENQEIYNAKKFLDLIYSEIKYSGLDFSQDKMKILERKISVCIDISYDLAKFDSYHFSQIPPVNIQLAYIKVMDILQRSKENLEVNDIIHKKIMQNAQDVYEKFKIFMNKNEIPQNQKYMSNFSIFNIMKDNLPLVIHGLRLKYLLFRSEKSRSPPSSKKLLLKAQKLIQKKLSFFSADQKSITLNKIKDFELIEENLINKSENIIISTSKLMNTFKFGDAEIQLIFLLEELNENNLPLIIEKVETQLEICKTNKDFGSKIMDIERIISNQDMLGAKSAIVKLKQNINLNLNKENIIPAINMRIKIIESKLTKRSNNITETSKKEKIGKTSKSTKKDNKIVLFNQFKEILIRENEIEKSKLAKLLKISKDELFERMLVWKEKIPFELENGVVILKIQQPKKKKKKKSIQRRPKKSGKKSRKKKENDVLEDLDDLLNMNFDD